MSGPMLQCPDCQHQQDIAALDGAPTFRCEGCGRPLKVPAQLQLAARPDPTTVQPTASGRAPLPGAQRPAPVPVWMRLVVWAVAVPIGLGVVFLLAKAFGWITTDQLLDTFTAEGWSRFAPLAKILPLSALLIATIVQASIAGLERRRRRTPRDSATPRDPRSAGRRAQRLEPLDARER